MSSLLVPGTSDRRESLLQSGLLCQHWPGESVLYTVSTVQYCTARYRLVSSWSSQSEPSHRLSHTVSETRAERLTPVPGSSDLETQS